MSAEHESSQEQNDDTPVRGARPEQSGYRRDDYWRKVDSDIDVDSGAPAGDTSNGERTPDPGLGADSPNDVQRRP